MNFWNLRKQLPHTMLILFTCILVVHLFFHINFCTAHQRIMYQKFELACQQVGLVCIWTSRSSFKLQFVYMW